jgi:hypothetical protein
MKYPLTPAEERLKAKVEKRKAKKNLPPTKERTGRYIKATYRDDFLKYFRVVRYWMQYKYDIRLVDLEMLLFLYSEGYFKKTDIKEFDSIFPWDKKRFSRLMQRGWVHMWRKPAPGRVALYEITPEAHQMIKTMYKKLNGQVISENEKLNPMFRNDATYTEKVHRNYIKKLNKSIRQEQRHARVSRYKLRRRESLYALRNGQTESGPQQP